MRDITTDEIIDAVRVAGGWYLRKRKWLKPALWRNAARNRVAPATPADVVRFMRATFLDRGSDYRGLNERDAVRYAEAVIAELRYHDHGLPTIDDAVLGLITGIAP
jgi:hypothetical protein